MKPPIMFTKPCVVQVWCLFTNGFCFYALSVVFNLHEKNECSVYVDNSHFLQTIYLFLPNKQVCLLILFFENSSNHVAKQYLVITISIIQLNIPIYKNRQPFDSFWYYQTISHFASCFCPILVYFKTLSKMCLYQIHGLH